MSALTDDIIPQILTLTGPSHDRHIIVAVDGRCGSGKSTLADIIRDRLESEYDISTQIFHMDDFYLRPEQRTEERMSEPGWNSDRARFLKEVLTPLMQNEQISYIRYDCASQSLCEPRIIKPGTVNIVEGSYSCHPDLIGLYDLTVFMTVGPDEQIRRIRQRDGDLKLELCEQKWIPLEEQYFAAFGVADSCDIKGTL